MVIAVLIKLKSKKPLVLLDGCSQNHLHPSVPCNQFHYLTVVVCYLSLPSARSTCLLADLFVRPPSHLSAACSCLPSNEPPWLCQSLSSSPSLLQTHQLCSFHKFPLPLTFMVRHAECGERLRISKPVHLLPPSLHSSVQVRQNGTNHQGSQTLERYILN